MTDIDLPAPVGNLIPMQECWARRLDVRDRAAFTHLFEECVAHFGKIDFMFNNAAIAIGGAASEYAGDEWQKLIDVNLIGLTNGVHLAYKQMRKQHFGHIINTSSIASLFPDVFTPIYSASKAAVTNLGMILRLEAEQYGVQVHTLVPGVIDTPILIGGKHGRGPHGISLEKLQKYWQKMQPMPPGQFANKALDAIALNKHLIILPKRWRLLAWCFRFCQPLWYWHSRRMLKRMSRKPAK
jgi:NAD(P)-dependent dehydrogenase (short-subunit alcohol dehydrogenase family)